jgi:predicted DNA-binding protein
MAHSVDSRPSRSVNVPEEILDKLGIIARTSGVTIRGLIIEIIEDYIDKKYPN